MADNVGLTTPRGSGTSGYVQKNRCLLRHRDKPAPYPKDWNAAKHRSRKPDAEILDHEAKRQIENKVIAFKDRRVEEELVKFRAEQEEAEQKAKVDGTWKKKTPKEIAEAEEEAEEVIEKELEPEIVGKRNEFEAERQKGKTLLPDARGLKSYQTHEQSRAETTKNERARKAFKISADYEEGSHWDKQEVKLRAKNGA